MTGSIPGDPSTLYTVGQEGLVYIWDLTSKRSRLTVDEHLLGNNITITLSLIHKFHDEGCLTGAALAVSKDSQLVAVGSTSGIVNVYERGVALASRDPKPTLTLANLTTAADVLAFNASAELLLFASSAKPAAARLVSTSFFPLNRRESRMGM